MFVGVSPAGSYPGKYPRFRLHAPRAAKLAALRHSSQRNQPQAPRLELAHRSAACRRELPNAVHDFGIGERGHIARVLLVRDRRQHAAHDLARPRLRHVGDDDPLPRPRDRTDLGYHGRRDFFRDVLRGVEARLQRHVQIRPLAFDLVGDRHHRRLDDLGNEQCRRFDFLRAEPVPGDVDHVVDAAEDAVVAVLRLHRAVTRHVRPVAPVLAFRVLAVTRVVHAHEAVRISPDGLHDAGPRIADADVARLARTGFQFLPFIVVDHRVDARDAGTRAARLHLVDSRHGAAEEAAGFGLPPGVHDYRLFLANDVEVPLPDFGFDGLAHGRHVLEAVVVLSGLVRTVLAQRADRGGRGVENVYAELLGDAPGAARIRVRRHALVHDRRSGERERPVHDIGVSRDPADVRHAPIDILGMDVLYVLRSPGYIGEIAADRVLCAFGLTS